MSKSTKNIIIIVAIVLLVFAIIFAVYEHFQSKPMNANTTEPENILPDANTGLENMLNDILDENTQQNNEENNNELQNTSGTTSANSNTQTSKEPEVTEDDNRMTPRETRAIELVKAQWLQDWGSIKDVSFNVSIQSDGKYGVTVYDTTTTQSIQFYIVDVDSGDVKER